ncbi:MAG: Bax protein [Candidatus Azotimanducaceae bacterium]|jgi:Bax protein
MQRSQTYPAITLLLLFASLIAGCTESGTLDSKPKATPASDTQQIAPTELGSKQTDVPDFNAIMHIPTKKDKFFAYLQKRIEVANNQVWAERKFVENYIEEHQQTNVTPDLHEELTRVAKRYRLDLPENLDENFLSKLLARIDVVPASMVLAQGANESAWGTSRFARDGKNFFGIWCYTEGCGIVPKGRTFGAKHEVRKFDTVQHGVSFYTHNINTGGAYAEFRRIRAELRANEEILSGVKLAIGLIRYSERGAAYVKEIRAIIKHNELSKYNIHRAEYLIED